MGDTNGPNEKKKPDWIYVLAPLFLLILCLGVINLGPRLIDTADRVSSAPTPTTTTPATAVNPTTTALPTPTPTPTQVPTPVATAPPTLPPDTAVQLLGPPPESAFPINDKISFYWHWSQPLAEEQRFALYLLVDDQELLLGTVDEPNLGAGFRLSASPGDFVETTGTIQWQVRLESELSERPLAESKVRSIALVAAP